jgi:two-component system alkaline phosphatase synthesis response regulator PhoP
MNETNRDAQPRQLSAQKQVLVVDDDPQIVRLLRSYLERDGFQILTATDGDQALAAIRTYKPALIILDLMLPARDGLSITQIVRAEPMLQHIPILMLTARVEDIDRILGLEMGADDYVTKPFNPREVVARVKAILRRSQPMGTETAEAEPILRLGGLQIDPQAHTVTKSQQAIVLTPSEYDILYLFMRNPGRAFTRTQIIEEGMGYEYAGFERTIDSHIKNLRRKLEDDPRQPKLIETVFGIGYRFNVQT